MSDPILHTTLPNGPFADVVSGAADTLKRETYLLSASVGIDTSGGAINLHIVDLGEPSTNLMDCVLTDVSARELIEQLQWALDNAGKYRA